MKPRAVLSQINSERPVWEFHFTDFLVSFLTLKGVKTIGISGGEGEFLEMTGGFVCGLIKTSAARKAYLGQSSLRAISTGVDYCNRILVASLERHHI